MKDILFEWNPWWNKEYKFEGIKREKTQEILQWIERREIISILGVRRAGKTTLLYELIDTLINSKKINNKNILFIKADDDRVKTEGIIDNTLEEYYKWINPEGKIFVFIDEIQETANWQKTLKRLYDLNKHIKIFLSGSNAAIIKEDLTTLLAGRIAYFEIFPFSFKEFLRANNVVTKNNFDILENEKKIKHLLTEYIEKGAFPEIILEKHEKIKDDLTKFYFDSIFYRDIVKRKNLRNPAKIEKLVKYFLQNTANLASFTKIAKIVELTTDSVVEYVKAMEDAYLIFPINLFEFSYKKQIISPKKIYCVDNGIRNIVGFIFSQDIGRLYENATFVELKRRGREIFYWKNNNECDFISRKNKNIQALQVCYEINKSKEREIQGLLEAMDRLKLNEGMILTDNYEREEKIDGKTIKYVPLWKWLLQE